MPNSDPLPLPLPLPSGIAHQLSSARLAVASFVQCALCRNAFARLDPLHPQPYEGQTLSVGLAAQADLRSALAEIESLALAARAARLLAPTALASTARPRMSPPLGPGAPQISFAHDDATGQPLLDAILIRFALSRDAILSIPRASEILAESTGSFDPTARAALQGAPLPSLGLDLDPLGAASRLTFLSQSLPSPSAQRLQPKPQATVLAQSNQALLAEARSSLGALRALRARAALACKQCHSIIDSVDCPPSPPDAPDAPDAILFFERWIDKLRQVSQAGQDAPASIGLSKLLGAIGACSRLESQALERARAPLDELADLRGRFAAFKAKARALASSGRPLADNAQSLQEACRLAIDERPVRLAFLRKAQRAFESCVSELGS